MATDIRLELAVGAFWDLIQAHLDTMEFPPSNRRLALRLGVAPQTVTNWRTLKDLPDRENLEAVADFVGKPYAEVLDAALTDTGYASGRAARKGKSGGRAARAAQDDAGEAPDSSGPEEGA